MGTLQSFDRMTYRYSYTTDSGQVVNIHVQGGEFTNYNFDGNKVTADEVDAAEQYAIEQWNKARAAYLEEAQEQELADRIARSRNED
jgi:hypothetical protein